MQITAAENVPSILADGLKAAVVPERIKRIMKRKREEGWQ